MVEKIENVASKKERKKRKSKFQWNKIGKFTILLGTVFCISFLATANFYMKSKNLVFADELEKVDELVKTVNEQKKEIATLEQDVDKYKKLYSEYKEAYEEEKEKKKATETTKKTTKTTSSTTKKSSPAPAKTEEKPAQKETENKEETTKEEETKVEETVTTDINSPEIYTEESTVDVAVPVEEPSYENLPESIVIPPNGVGGSIPPAPQITTEAPQIEIGDNSAQ